MTLGIITSIQQSNAYQNYMAGSAPERWAGRTVELIGAASAAVSPYFQRKPVAFVALVVANVSSVFFGLICIMVNEKLIMSQRVNEQTQTKKTILNLSAFFSGYVGGVIVFSKFTQLPFGKWANIAISVSTLIGVVRYFQDDKSKNNKSSTS